MNKEFRHRGEEPGRLENFSDACFALAITLLLISTSPPTNFLQIKRFVYDLIPFVFCIAVILAIWHQHFVFFFRYGLRNGKIVALNSIFLVIVLFYVYPLKFLARLILYPIALLTDNQALIQEFSGVIEWKDVGDLMIIYGLGYAGVFFTLMLMYRYALKMADQLELSEIEKFDTEVSVKTNMLMGIIPLISVMVAWILRGHWTAGMIGGLVYMLYQIVMPIYGKRVDKRRNKFLTALKTVPATGEIST
ncbi:MAG TPA: TMEM175 family protein [Cyclobacteriaceae bacterium]|nr:TMEM175 family protein [Cyclobacteriaceae bacterium]